MTYVARKQPDLSVYATTSSVTAALALKADVTSLADYYTKTAADALLALKADASAVPSSLDDLTDVNLGVAPVNGDVLLYSSGAWTIGRDAFAAQLHAHSFASLTSKPTTVSGYGITDAVTLGGTQTITGAKTFTGAISYATSGNGGLALADNNRRLDLGMLSGDLNTIYGAYFTCFGRDNGLSNQKGCATFVIDARSNASAEFSVYRYNGSWSGIFGVTASGAATIYGLSAAATPLTLKAAGGVTVPVADFQVNNVSVASVTKEGFIQTLAGDGAPFGTPPNGSMYVDNDSEGFYVRVNGTWRQVSLI